MVTSKAISSSVQLSLFPCQGTGVNDAQNGNPGIAKLSTNNANRSGSMPMASLSKYLTTRGGLCRLLMLFPGDTPVTEALRLAPSVLTNSRKEVAV